MSALIQELIDKSDNFEVVRDQIGAILLVESLNQEALAAAGYQNVTVAPGGNVGNGTCSGVVVVGSPAIGQWVLVCSTAVPQGGVFDLMDPDGGLAESGLTITPGEPTTFTDQAGLTFTLAAGPVDFDVGDSFELPIAHFDPALWRLNIYRERSEPWADFIDAPTTPPPPIVNVSWDNTTFDQQRSNAVERQRAIAIFHIDCYGYAVSSGPVAPETEGHNPGDEGAALAVARAVRLVRNILMSGPYTYLAMQGVVGFRWPQTIQSFQPQADGRAVQNVLAARIALEVHFNEFSPQAQGQPLELISAQVKRAETGQLLLSAEYPQETDP